jgi:hypothetical protein
MGNLVATVYGPTKIGVTRDGSRATLTIGIGPTLVANLVEEPTHLRGLLTGALTDLNHLYPPEEATHGA